jgi:hypothetical protein
LQNSGVTRALALVRPAIPSSQRLVGIGLLALALAVALWVSSVLQPDWFGDADWYASALPAVQGNAPLYDPIMLAPHVAVRPVHFNLPPAVALLAPIAAMGRLPWGLLMLSCLLIGLALVWPRLRHPWDLVAAGAVVVSVPFQSAVIFANVNSLVVLLLAVAVRWPRTAGTAIGIATALKVAPVFAFAWLIGRRDWNGLATGVAVAAGLTVGAALLIDPAALVNFWIVRWNEMPRLLPLAPSLNSLGLPPVVGYVAAAGIAAVAAYRASLLLAVLACLVAVPQLHAHYWVWLLVPILARGRPVLEDAVERMRELDWAGARALGEPGS